MKQVSTILVPVRDKNYKVAHYKAVRFKRPRIRKIHKRRLALASKQDADVELVAIILLGACLLAFLLV